MIRIYLADNHKMFLRGLRRIFNEDPGLELIGMAEDGKTALDDIKRERPDVAILDIAMPGLSGLEVLSDLRENSIPVKVLLLTGTEAREIIFKAITQGSNGFMLKTADWDELIEAIKKIHAGEEVFAPEALRLVADQIQQGPMILTGRESQILAILGQDYDVPEIASRLQIEPSTVRTHIRSIYKKLGVTSRGAAVAEAMRRKLIE